MRTKLTQSGNVCVPQDVESSVGLALYGEFERLYQFERELGIAHQLSWPRRVGLALNMVTPKGAAVHNNAHYIPDGDVIAVVPYTLDGLPLAANHGIISHELFHAHFQREVLAPLEAMIGPSPQYLTQLFYPAFFGNFIESTTTSSARYVNDIVIRGWNEGLADLYGATFSHDPDFILKSLTTMGNVRSLNLEIGPMASANQWLAWADQAKDPEQLVGYSYFQGTLLARLLFQIAENERIPARTFLASIIKKLHLIPAAIQSQMNAQILDSDVVVPLLIGDLTLGRKSCELVHRAVSKDIMLRGFSQCGPL